MTEEKMIARPRLSVKKQAKSEIFDQIKKNWIKFYIFEKNKTFLKFCPN